MDSAITLEEVLDYLGIDYADEQVEANVGILMAAARAWVCGAVGTDIDWSDDRSKVLMLVVVADMYDNRGMTEQGGAVTSNTRKLVSDMVLQLRLEGRRRSANGD